ncbi:MULTISPECIES: DNA polymerase III subunit alpha [unclassified Aureimonas]|uniref:DNA polymerase III subunit alpha n=1 Tax=unclassified Aureimonas TaxID=2615206 RepID=UPI0006F39CC1|nr:MULTISPECIES: DNA polymerase III subunit alpha [unclassified Aureimonas]KQT60446.1 DNA polymerase III subunit alpha [Aureimonas sp. Leaf427]KQT79324.1 DNA polymerase III subunit alpha [Aureimonas sp. Leaf460]
MGEAQKPDGKGPDGAAAAPLKFIHLRTHSAFSLLEGALRIDQIVKHAKSDGAPAIGIADTNNLFGALEFSEKAAKSGVQPIVGCQLDVDFGDADPEASSSQRDRANLAPDAPMVLIAATEEGYGNLVEIVSLAYLGHEADARPHVKIDWLRSRAGGIIALTGGPLGPIGSAIAAGRSAIAKSRLEALSAIYGDRLYVELQRQEGRGRRIESETVQLAYAMDLPLVATNEPFFFCPDDFDAHDALIAVACNRLVSHEDRRRLTRDHCLKSQAEMAVLFADLPEALDNTIEIARRCSYRPRTRKPILPRFAGADADPAEAERVEALELRRQAEEGLEARLAMHGPCEGQTVEVYRARLAFELDVIERMKFPGYFLIVADFIKWAKAQGIPVGPGRGSGAGSLVAYSLTITDLDPLRFNLLFERFLNPDRVSMPDFDIDFCQDRRGEVIRYVQDKYGREQVGQIITFGTLQARACLRDVGRVLEMSYGHVDKLCKMVPANPANPVTLAQALIEEPRLQEAREKEEIVDRLISIALKLEGLYRHASTHAAGIVIGDRPLSKLVPMYRDPRSDMPVTQYNMKWVEQAGLVKFDFLGLKTLTTLKTAVDLIARRGVDIDLGSLPLDDKKSYEMLTRGETVGVFQVESVGMRKALIGMRPDRFEDIIALVALYRPGPMENIPTYNACKHGEEEPDFLHPMIESILKETQGVIIYQEQVMQIAQVLSGYSLGEADLLRRAMGKKIRAEMDVQRVRFVEGAVKNGLTKPQSNMIFDLLAKFADYGFNKSHAAAYALVAYQTAYLKANFPAEFLAASMTLDTGNTDKLNDFRMDAARLGIEVVPPSVQTSHKAFEVDGNRIFYSLAAIKGVGEQAVEHIVAARGDRGFASLEDFCARIDPKIVNKRTLESLIAAGALDTFGHDRARLTTNLERLSGYAARLAEGRSSGQNDMFGGSGAEPERLYLNEGQGWTSTEKLMREFGAIGFYLSAHPLDEYSATLKRLNVKTHADVVAGVRRGATAGKLAGTVTSRQERKTRTGGKIGIISLSDSSGQYEVVLFSEMLTQYRELLEPGASVIILVGAEERPEGVSLRAQSVQSLEDEAVRMQKALRVFMRDAAPLNAFRGQLQGGGDAEVSLVLIRAGGEREIEISLPGRYRVSPQMASAIKAAPGVLEVELS